MNEEQKRKEYLEAVKAWLEIAKKNNNTIIQILENLFPELKESGDERIRKEIYRYFRDLQLSSDREFSPSTTIDEILAWLEKQGEQKPDDKIGPKFNVGDWITNGEYTWKVIDIKPLDYILQSSDVNVAYDSISYVDEHFHLWTIKDAKDGNVLVNDDDIFIFDGTLEETLFPFAYCGIINGDFGIYSRKFPFTHNKNIYPATRKQHNLLFQKMHEAGYKWDSDNKELKKIEPSCSGKRKY